MSQVEAKIAQLRQAASQFQATGSRVKQSIETTDEIVDGIFALGYESPAAAQFVLRYRSQRGVIDDWMSQLVQFATKLSAAADDLDKAVSAATVEGESGEESALPVGAVGFSTVTYGYRRGGRTPSISVPQPETAPAAAETPLSEYISEGNRPLYEQLGHEQRVLAGHYDQLEVLAKLREDKVGELDALVDRLRSFNPNVDIEAVPRVQALKLQIEGFDAEIAGVNGSIQTLEQQIAELSTRLERVKPGPGADLTLIQSLANGETAQWIKDNTQDCVNYVVNRMPMPEGIPIDAHMWDEQAQRFTQYGVTSGDIPLPGSVIVLEQAHSYADDRYGHVMYVEHVDGAMVWVTDNMHAKPVLLSDLTNELSGPNLKYLYFPWHTQA